MIWEKLLCIGTAIKCIWCESLACNEFLVSVRPHWREKSLGCIQNWGDLSLSLSIACEMHPRKCILN
ncbi:hypothetical protein CIPAW_01G154200 [Carya illinoinensis]|uniref:Uncharacterized protein n=1 Tax=Carya illinoinensis TaxID=32201 RepID=A0A8T1RNB5_CARIL|nr:hypothetical protein CIPAW_01G154200 [Carya illinoinensis]